MRKRRIFISPFLLSLLVLCLVNSGCSQPGESDNAVSVREGESLQSVIDRVDSGAVLHLDAGTWTENIVISKAITIRSATEEPAILQGARDGHPVVWIDIEEDEEQPSVILEGLHILNAIGESCAEFSAREQREICPYGVLITGVADVQILSCTLAGNRTGVASVGTGDLTINDCDIYENDWEGVYIAGITKATISDSHLRANGSAGVGVAANGIATIQDCVIENNTGDGIAIADRARATMVDCVISDNGWSGVKLITGAIVIVNSCRIENNAHFGIAPLSLLCYTDPNEQDFTGRIGGTDNWIPGPGQPRGNIRGALCPAYPGRFWSTDFVLAVDSTQ